MSDINNAETELSKLSMFGQLSRLGKYALGLLNSLLELLILEGQLAARSVLIIVGLTLCILLLLVTSWLLIIGLFAIGLIALGLAWPVAIAIILGVNLILTGLCLALILPYQRNLNFSALRRQLNSLGNLKGEQR